MVTFELVGNVANSVDVPMGMKFSNVWIEVLEREVLFKVFSKRGVKVRFVGLEIGLGNFIALLRSCRTNMVQSLTEHVVIKGTLSSNCNW